MKKSLVEQLEKMHRLNYGKEVINEGFMDTITKMFSGKKDDKKADEVKGEMKDFYGTFEAAINDKGISQEERGEMTFKKEAETLQIGLSLLGYKLPQHGVDGKFGPETAEALEKFKSDNKILNESASQLRDTIKSLGYTEKGNELDNGGVLGSEISLAVSDILKRFKVKKPDASIKVTGGNDLFHKNRNSRHKTGDAVDMVVVPYSIPNLDALIECVKEHQKINSKVVFIDEYRNPSSGATAPHLHISIGGPEGKGGGRTGAIAKSVSIATPEVLKRLVSLLKSRNITPQDILKYTNVSVDSNGNVSKSISAKGQQLLQDPAFQEGLKEISERINIDQKFIIKMMNHESKMDPNVMNSIGCVGLIQFCNDGTKGIKEINGVRYSLNDLRYNLPLQMKAIGEFWGVGARSGKIKTPEDLYIYNFFPIAAGKPDNFVLQSKKQSAELVAKSNPKFNDALGRPRSTPLTVGDCKLFYRKTGMV